MEQTRNRPTRATRGTATTEHAQTRPASNTPAKTQHGAANRGFPEGKRIHKKLTQTPCKSVLIHAIPGSLSAYGSRKRKEKKGKTSKNTAPKQTRFVLVCSWRRLIHHPWVIRESPRALIELIASTCKRLIELMKVLWSHLPMPQLWWEDGPWSHRPVPQVDLELRSSPQAQNQGKPCPGKWIS